MPVNESTIADSTVISFGEQLAAFARERGTGLIELIDLSGTPMRVREELVRRHGPEEGWFGVPWVAPGRTVIDVPGLTWPVARLEECLDESIAGIWFDTQGREVRNPRDPGAPAGIVLLCPLCGLDCT